MVDIRSCKVVVLLYYSVIEQSLLSVNIVVPYYRNDIIIMCILTFWLSASFLSLAHTCFSATYARACELFLFDIIYFYFRPSLVSCPAHYFPPPPNIRHKQVLFIVATVSPVLCGGCAPRFFYHHAARVS